MNTLGIIPARGGSKGIPGKNLAPLAGRPLIDYTIDAARNARMLTGLIVSTDDEAIAQHAKASGVDVPFMRPQSLAQDVTPILPVLLDLLNTLEKQGETLPDAVCLLQPTSPLRPAYVIDEAIRMLEDSDADAVVTVVEVPHHFNPVSVMKMVDAFQLVPYLEGEGSRVTRRQDKPRLYARNGPAVVVTRTKALRETGSVYGTCTLALPMDRAESIDIDEPLDLILAEALLHHAQRGGR